jgi:hypothetical protein
VTKSIPKVLERGKPYFQEFWKTLKREEQDLLQRLVENQPLEPRDNKVVRRLIKKEILANVPGIYSIKMSASKFL